MTVPDLLAAALRRDAARPLLTWYDGASGARVELSVATTANWVAKTGNLLQDSLGVQAGAVVALDLPPHWQRPVWLLACWSAGCVVTTDRAGADVVVVGPDGLDPVPDADEVVACAQRPLGGRFTSPLPAGVLDYDAEVLGHGDRFAPWQPVTAGSPALASGADVLDEAGLLATATARHPGWEVGERVLTCESDDLAAAALDLVAVLAADGSLVVAVGHDDAARDDLASTERVTVRQDEPSGGSD